MRRPRRLFTRALLFIVLPIVLLQILTGILIVQRYFDRVTGQLSRHVIDDIQFALDQSPSRDELIYALKLHGYQILTTDNQSNQFGFADLSGRYILKYFKDSFGPETLIDNRDRGTVHITLMPEGSGLDAPITLAIRRTRLAPINPHQFLINTLALSIVVTIIALYFMRNQIRSIRKLSGAAEAYGRGEIVEYSPSGAVEVRSAGRSFLAMRSRIERQREQRVLMLAGISHDIRTPLTRMRLSAELIEDRKFAAEIGEEISTIEAMIDSFLEYARGSALEEKQDINLSEIFAALALRYQKLAPLPRTDLTLRLRKEVFSRALGNLLANAERYGERVELSLSQSRLGLLIHVDDDGPGIAPQDHDAAIKAFSRLDDARNLDAGGHSGLGLAIAQDAVRQHEGQLSLKKSPLGGLRVEILLPASLIITRDGA